MFYVYNRIILQGKLNYWLVKACILWSLFQWSKIWSHTIWRICKKHNFLLPTQVNLNQYNLGTDHRCERRVGSTKGVIRIRKSMFWFRFMVFNATFNNISAISVLLVEETGVPRENHQPVSSHWQTLSLNVVSSTPRHGKRYAHTTLVVKDTDCTGSCKSNYHTITTMTGSICYQAKDAENLSKSLYLNWY